MKRMSGGGGGGSQIFSIGKSKAKLFDEKVDVKTTFKGRSWLRRCKRRSTRDSIFFKKTPQNTQNLEENSKRSASCRFTWDRKNSSS